MPEAHTPDFDTFGGLGIDLLSPCSASMSSKTFADDDAQVFRHCFIGWHCP